MPKKVAISQLNASSMDIINTIRANAPQEYQNLIPEVHTLEDIRKVGQVFDGYPALANNFIGALLNRIAIVKIKSAIFNNPYVQFKKGYLDYGETIEEVFVNIAKAREFSVEKAPAREFKRTLPDVKAAFHVMNYKAQYPMTIQNEDLRQAFTSINGVEDMIARLVNSMYTGNEYDEFLLFKYLLIKGVTKGQMKTVPVDMTDIKNAGKKFRGTSNKLEFMSTKYNASGVHTVTKKAD